MSQLLNKCEEYFSTRDFYDIFNVEKTATAKDIKKAYYKLSLLYHPDRVEETNKELSTEKFKLLSNIHSILQDEDKRKVYDEGGSVDDDDFFVTNWVNYWRGIFKKITTEDIDKFKTEYIGSDTERNDIKKAYVGTKGDMNRIIEMVPFSNCENEPRLIKIVREMVDNGEVEEFSCFFNEPKRKKTQRKLKEERERRRSEQLNISDNDLADEIHQRQTERLDSLFSTLEAKYGKEKSTKRKPIMKLTEDGIDKRSSKRKEQENTTGKRTRLTRSCKP